jgi:predicted adenine nucleotide alpha hydrolase (AANH) superfamily ATPase
MPSNYQKEMEKNILHLQANNMPPTLFLHSCCAPCSSYVLEYLSNYFKITVFYYNPNIFPDAEYLKRVQEQKSFIKQLKTTHPVSFLAGEFDKSRFHQLAAPLKHEPEGGVRCYGCYHMRLNETAVQAKQRQMDYFTTTLTISPHKDATVLNQLGCEIGAKLGIKYLVSDFKKKNGFKRSVELSHQYGMYRQDYCGCIYSKEQRERTLITIK